MRRYLVLLGISSTLFGCATMFSGETQQVQVNATVNNEPVQNVNCTVENGRGSWNVTSTSVATIRRDGNPLAINCTSPDKSLYGTTSVSPYYNTTNLWNIPLTIFFIVPGAVGWIWDGVDGTTNEYPKTVSVALTKPVDVNNSFESKPIESTPLQKAKP